MQTEELQIAIGKKIKELRVVNQWTQEQIAEQLHLCRNAYSDIELGKTDICISRLAQLAEFFGVSLGYFVSDEKIAVYLTGNFQAFNQENKECHVYFAEDKLQHKLEKVEVKLEGKEREVELLSEKINDLNRIIKLLENPKT